MWVERNRADTFGENNGIMRSKKQLSTNVLHDNIYPEGMQTQFRKRFDARAWRMYK